jgi:hypothetical protein
LKITVNRQLTSSIDILGGEVNSGKEGKAPPVSRLANAITGIFDTQPRPVYQFIEPGGMKGLVDLSQWE